VCVCVCVCVCMRACVQDNLIMLKMTLNPDSQSVAYVYVWNCQQVFLEFNTWAAVIALNAFRNIGYEFWIHMQNCAFSALTLLVRWQEGHPACKNWVVKYWCGYSSGERCKWFAYGSADVTATPLSLVLLKSRMVYLSGPGLPRLSWKIGH